MPWNNLRPSQIPLHSTCHHVWSQWKWYWARNCKHLLGRTSVGNMFDDDNGAFSFRAIKYHFLQRGREVLQWASMAFQLCWNRLFLLSSAWCVYIAWYMCIPFVPRQCYADLNRINKNNKFNALFDICYFHLRYKVNLDTNFSGKCFWYFFWLHSLYVIG